MATIRDVAKKAEVSVATVSRILNDLPGYTSQTKKRVLKAIDELGYTRNALASGLSTRKTNTLAVLFPSVTSRFASTLLKGIEDAASNNRCSVIVCNTDSNGRRTREYLQVLAEKRVDGIVFVSEWLTAEYEKIVERMAVPMVLVSTFTDTYPVPYVRVDDRLAAYNAVEYLISRGHRNIGMVAGTRSDRVAGFPRVEGYQQALRDAGIGTAGENVVHGDFHFHRGREAALDLLTRRRNLTAVFAASDEMALAVISAARQLGIAVPDKLSVIGYDDIGDAEMANPPLTTIHQPLFEMGRMAVKLLFDPVPHSIIMPHHIVERESVKELS